MDTQGPLLEVLGCEGFFWTPNTLNNLIDHQSILFQELYLGLKGNGIMFDSRFTCDW